jgi:hypothetical protein
MKSNVVLFALIFLVLVSCGSNPIEQSDRDLFWSERRALSWNDFQVGQSSNTELAASTISGITLDHRLELDTVLVFVSAVFDRKSYYVKGRENDLVLKHEQGHFDISEIIARKLKAKAAQ